MTFNKYDTEKWNESRQYEKIKMELLSNNEADGEEIDNEQVTIYENSIRTINLRYNFKFDNLFYYYTK